MNMYKIAVVGSRRRNTSEDRLQVYAILHAQHELWGSNLVVVSGGCPKGADKFAADWAKANSVPLVEFPAVITGNAPYLHAAAYYARNAVVASFCDRMYAQVAADRKGGTEDACRHARVLGKAVYLITDTGDITPAIAPRTEVSLGEFDG